MPISYCFVLAKLCSALELCLEKRETYLNVAANKALTSEQFVVCLHHEVEG